MRYNKRICLLLFFLTFFYSFTTTIYAADRYEFPIRDDYVVTSVYGQRIDPFTYERKYHYGIDLAAPLGTEVYAACDGIVYAAGDYSDGYGNKIIIQSTDGSYQFYYAHLNSMDVSVSDEVIKGQPIGTVGSTGRSTGNHLHFGVKEYNETADSYSFIDPTALDFTQSFGTTLNNLEDMSEYLNIPKEYGLTIYAMYHQTGVIELHINGGFPKFDVYKSFDGQNWTYQGSVNNNLYTEYGLDNGQTVYFKVVDNYGKYNSTRYTPQFLTQQIYPLQVQQINDDQVHIKWDNVDFSTVDIYLDDTKIIDDFSGTEYTLDELTPNTQYAVHLVNRYDYRSNKITFRTTDELTKIEEILSKLFMPNMTDSNSDGTPDNMEQIQEAMDELLDKLTGDVHNEVSDAIDYTMNEITFDKEIPDFGMAVNWRGIEIDLLNFHNPNLIPYYEFIRSILLAILTVTFVILVINLFDIQFKV